MDEESKYRCLMITGEFIKIPISFNNEKYSFEGICDEKDALNDIKMKNIDAVIIMGPLKHLLDDELYKIITERIENENKKVVVLLIKESGEEFMVKRFSHKGDRFSTSFFTTQDLNIGKLIGNKIASNVLM